MICPAQHIGVSLVMPKTPSYSGLFISNKDSGLCKFNKSLSHFSYQFFIFSYLSLHPPIFLGKDPNLAPLQLHLLIPVMARYCPNLLPPEIGA